MATQFDPNALIQALQNFGTQPMDAAPPIIDPFTLQPVGQGRRSGGGNSGATGAAPAFQIDTSVADAYAKQQRDLAIQQAREARAAAAEQRLTQRADTAAAKEATSPDALAAEVADRTGIPAGTSAAAVGAKPRINLQVKWPEVVASPEWDALPAEEQKKQAALWIDAQANEVIARAEQRLGKPLNKDVAAKVRKDIAMVQSNITVPKRTWADSDILDTAQNTLSQWWYGRKLRDAATPQERDEAIANLAESKRSYEANLSAYTKDEQKKLNLLRNDYLAASPDGQLSPLQEAELGLKAFNSDPWRNILGNAPPTIASIGASLGGGVIGGAAGTLAGPAGTAVGATGGAASAGAAVGQDMTSAYVAADIADRVQSLPDATLSASPLYQRLLQAHGGNAAVAKSALIQELVSDAEPLARTLGAATGVFEGLIGAGKAASTALRGTTGGAAAANIVTKALSRAGLASVGTKGAVAGMAKALAPVTQRGAVAGAVVAARPFVAEGAQEFAEEAGEQVLGNRALQQVDPNQRLFEGAVEAGTVGALTGAATTGGIKVAGKAGNAAVGPVKDQGDVVVTREANGQLAPARRGATAEKSNLVVDPETGMARLRDLSASQDPGAVNTMSAMNMTLMQGVAVQDGAKPESGTVAGMGLNVILLGDQNAGVGIPVEVNGQRANIVFDAQGKAALADPATAPAGAADIVTEANAIVDTMRDATVRFAQRQQGWVEAVPAAAPAAASPTIAPAPTPPVAAPAIAPAPTPPVAAPTIAPAPTPPVVPPPGTNPITGAPLPAAPTPAATPAPEPSLQDSVGQFFDYGGITGELTAAPDGYYITPADGSAPVLVEGGLSGQAPSALGLTSLNPQPNPAALAAGRQLGTVTPPAAPTELDRRFDAAIDGLVGLLGEAEAANILESLEQPGINFAELTRRIENAYFEQLDAATRPAGQAAPVVDDGVAAPDAAPAAPASTGTGEATPDQTQSGLNNPITGESLPAESAPAPAPAPDATVEDDYTNDAATARATFNETLNRVATPFTGVFPGGRRVRLSPTKLGPARRKLMLAHVDNLFALGFPTSIVQGIKGIGNVTYKNMQAGMSANGNFLLTPSFWASPEVDQLHTVAHELAHELENVVKRAGGVAPSQRTSWTAAHQELRAWYDREPSNVFSYPFQTRYPESSMRSESFAQAVGLYYTDNAKLEAEAPLAYAAVADAIAETRRNQDANRTSAAGDPAAQAAPGANGSQVVERTGGGQTSVGASAGGRQGTAGRAGGDAQEIQLNAAPGRDPAQALADAQAGRRATPATTSRGVIQAATAAARQGQVTPQLRDALTAAKTSVFDKITEAFADSLLPVVRWAQKLPVPPVLREKIIGAMYRAPNVRDAIMQRAADKYGGEDLRKALADVLSKAQTRDPNTTAEDVLYYAGMWTTARYAPIKNQLMLEAAWAEVEQAQNDYDAAVASGSANPKRLAALQAALDEAISVFEDREFAKNQGASVSNHVGLSGKPVGLAAGMNDAQAQAWMARVEQLYGRADLERAANHVYRMNAFRMATDIESGRVDPATASLFSPDTANLRNEMDLLQRLAANPASNQAQLEAARDDFVTKLARVSRYVPTTGDSSKAIEQDALGQGFKAPNVATDKRLQGRTSSLPDDGISASLGGMQRSAAAAAWTDFGKAVQEAYFNMTDDQRKAAGMAEADLTVLDRLGDNLVIVGAKGYTIGDGSELAALRKENVDDRSRLLSIAEQPTRWFAYAVTQLNPLFAPINAIRDVWERSEFLRTRSLTTAAGRPVDAKRAAQRMIQLSTSGVVLGDLRKALWSRNPGAAANSKYAQLLREFEEYGGGGAKYGASLARDRGTLAAGLGKLSNSTPANTLKAVKTIVDRWNGVFESVSALSAYAALREQGMSKEAAAAAALDLMNFRKQGAVMPIVRVFYAFAQPAVTGGSNLVQLLKTKEGQKRAAGYVLGLMALQMLMASIAGDDDELGKNRIDLLDDYTKDRSLPIPIPGTDAIFKMPIGFGMPMLANVVSRQIWGFAKGEQTLTAAAGEAFTRGVLPSFSPVDDPKVSASEDPVQWLAQLVAPTLAKPSVNVAINRSGLGGKILREDFLKQDEFKSEQGSPLTAEFYKGTAQSIRQITGIDFAPEQVKELLRTVAIGPLRVAQQVWVDNPNKEVQGKPTTLPVVNSLLTSDNPNAIIAEIGRFEDEGGAVLREYNADPEGVLDTRDQAVLDLYNEWVAADKSLQAESSKLTRAGVAKGINPERLAVRQQRIEAQVDFIRRYNAIAQ